MSELSNSFKLAVVQTALDKMLYKSSHFSICDLDELAKVLGRNISQTEEYAYLRLLHCVNWSTMTSEVRRQARLLVLDLLGFSEMVTLNPEEDKPQDVKTETRSFFNKLLGLKNG